MHTPVAFPISQRAKKTPILDPRTSLERPQVQQGQRGQGAVTSHTAQQQDGGSTEGPGGRGEQSGVGGRVILCEKMPLHQLSEGLLITRPGGEERWGEEKGCRLGGGAAPAFITTKQVIWDQISANKVNYQAMRLKERKINVELSLDFDLSGDSVSCLSFSY